MSPPLPDRIEPKRLAARDAVLTGTLWLKSMPRLSAAVLDKDGPIEVRLEFHRDEEGRDRATGRVAATLQVTCQRCLQAMELSIDEAVDLCFLLTEKGATTLAPTCEPVLLESGLVTLTTMIEDQLLLALPFAPVHAPGSDNCREIAGAEVPENNGEAGRQHPFAELAGLKTRAGRED